MTTKKWNRSQVQRFKIEEIISDLLTNQVFNVKTNWHAVAYICRYWHHAPDSLFFATDGFEKVLSNILFSYVVDLIMFRDLIPI